MDFLGPYVAYIVGALIVVAAIVIALLVYRALGGTIKGRRGQRLAVSEYYEIDKTRRLVLIRRDGVEHLLMIGGPQDLVVETAIDAEEEAPVSETRTEPPFETPPARTAPVRPAPRPAVFGERPPLRAVEREPQEPRVYRNDQDA